MQTHDAAAVTNPQLFGHRFQTTEDCVDGQQVFLTGFRQEQRMRTAIEQRDAELRLQ